jgi:integrase
LLTLEPRRAEFLSEALATIATRWAELWRPLTLRLELDRVGFHDLRHYYAAALIRHGASVKTVQDRLGHKSAVTTLDTYGPRMLVGARQLTVLLELPTGLPPDSRVVRPGEGFRVQVLHRPRRAAPKVEPGS